MFSGCSPRDPPEGAPKPDYGGLHGLADRLAFVLSESALRLLPEGPHLPAPGHCRTSCSYISTSARGVRGLVLAGYLRHRHGLSRRAQRPGDRATNDWYIDGFAARARPLRPGRALVHGLLRHAHDRHRRRIRLCQGDESRSANHPQSGTRNRRISFGPKCSVFSSSVMFTERRGGPTLET